MPVKLKQNWGVKNGANFAMCYTVRDLVRFRQLNLLGNWPLKGMFDVIFCRNVMIYFDEPTKERLLDRLCAKLQPGGYLYIGHSERLVGPAARVCEPVGRSEEHTSELQSLMRISYAVFCLQHKNNK